MNFWTTTYLEKLKTKNFPNTTYLENFFLEFYPNIISVSKVSV